MKTFYIAGPMRGYHHFNFPAFDRCAAELRISGYGVISPAEHDREIGFDETLNRLDGFDLAASIMWDLEQIAHNVDGIVLLPGWEKSSGVAVELSLARMLCREVYVYSPDRPTGAALYPLVDEPKSVIPTIAEAEVEPAQWPCVRCERPIGDSFDQCGVNDEGVICPTCTSRPDGEKSFGFNVQADPWPTTAGETRIIDPTTGGEKGSKIARFDLIPAEALWALAEHYGKGAQKYDPHNWRRGYAWSLSFAAMMRHAWAFWMGENLDAETGSSHLTAVAWHAFTLRTFWAEQLGTDDRPGLS